MKPEHAEPFTYSVRPHGDFLATRDLAKTVLRDLEDHVPPDAAAVVIEFTDVDAMTISFADEFLGRYYSALASSDVSPAVVTLTGLNEELRETVAVSLQRRDLIAAEAQHEVLTLLAASDVLRQTYQLAHELGTFTAMNVADRLGITAPNANNRLKRLVAARALIRQQGIAERGGKEFIYSVPNLLGQTNQTGSKSRR